MHTVAWLLQLIGLENAAFLYYLKLIIDTPLQNQTACMTLELAEFGKPFITSIINGSDIVPTLSASSVHDFIAELDDVFIHQAGSCI
ncbi:hypothetical protein VNO80_09018 [Phaseolus coccineus]|uniref:Uncharacterized protein n=1 Tax=Phaseolus coccineus TaxID=3886 RepID=A0AAN9NBS1_PHACN